MLSADNLCKQFGPRSGPIEKQLILKQADANKSMKNYPACKDLKRVLMHMR